MTEIVRCAIRREARFLIIATVVGTVGLLILGVLL